MKNLIFVFALLISLAGNTQISKVNFKASGLTCSMCSNAIYKALKTIDFVEDVQANLKDYSFEVSFKKNAAVDFDKIKKKVEGAGFYVHSFFATIEFNNVALKDDQPVKAGFQTLVFVKAAERTLNGETRVKLLDKGFVSSREYKKTGVSASLTDVGIYHVSL